MHTKSSACMFTAAFFTMDKYSSNRDGRPQASKSVVANPHNGINGRRARPQRPSLNAAQRSQPTILLHTTDRQGQKAGQGCQEGRDGAGGGWGGGLQAGGNSGSLGCGAGPWVGTMSHLTKLYTLCLGGEWSF